jgi:hypothetical protein
MSWTDELFYRQFRISRGDFFIICDKIKNIYPSHSENIHIGIESYIHSQKMGNISTPSSGPVTLEIKLAITLRMLAGASALDMIWYGVQLATIPSIFQFIIQCLDTVLLNKDIYNFHPDNDNFIEEVNHIASNWSSIMIKKKGFDLFKGTILAGDGLVVSINAPNENETGGLPLSCFRNRKGCWAINVQAFCDSFCRFRYFEVSWPGSTNDITAYKQTKLYNWFLDNRIPEEFHMVLDEAYSSIGGNFHLTPYSKSQLKKARTVSEENYCKLKSFNNVLSSQRITIERAFGIFVRKWGILWKPLEYSLQTNILILSVCSKLHNISINHWIKQGYLSKEIAAMDELYQQQKDEGIFMGWDTQFEEEYDIFDIGNIEELFGNHLRNEPASRIISDRKKGITETIYNCGIRYQLRSDNDFTYN